MPSANGRKTLHQVDDLSVGKRGKTRKWLEMHGNDQSLPATEKIREDGTEQKRILC